MGYNMNELRHLVDKVTGEDFEPWEENTPDDESELYELIEEHDEDVIQAAIEFKTTGGSSVEIHDLLTTMRESYRGEHRTFGDFARAEELYYLEAGGEAAVAVYNKLADYVDWEAYGSTPEWSDYMAIRKYAEDDPRTTIYVFRD